ncbi:hypothetical protein IF188_19185 [Microbacterium sp. NEAU-LLC]|uniref:DUF4064 domain-containing protein n=1 Tax=Microbacterium helvum TaxID=2773713 RepID=A0ABR8NVQ0_9MICO|nr:hypothetical protein [Microbacterium helvum]MBD3943822.1 hypothetical protein [Microbacterium helvum]
MTTNAPPPPGPARPARSPHAGKKVASAVLSSVMLLFGLVFTPIAITGLVAAEPLGSEWSTGSNMINVVFTWIFGFALLFFAAGAAASAFLARTARSTGLFVYALVVTAITLVGAIAMLAAAAIMVSG